MALVLNILRKSLPALQRHSIRNSLIAPSIVQKNLFISRREYTGGKMSKTALVLVATGTEDLELVVSADVLRRAGIKVIIAGLKGPDPVKCACDVVILPDTTLEDVKSTNYDAIVLPGGFDGSRAFCESKVLGELLKKQEAEGRIVAAICAAPTALAAHSIGIGKSVTSYPDPSIKEKLVDQYKYVEDQKVVKDGKIITSRGPGTAYDFALTIAEELVGADTANQVASGMLIK